MTKIHYLLIVSLLAVSCAIKPVTVSRVDTVDGKPCLIVDDKPYAVYGAQIRIDIFRNCDYLNWEDIESYFAKAKELGVNTVELSYTWRFLEPERDQYCFDEIDHLLSLTVKYGLKAELLWFGSNMIGDSYSFFVPSYILRNQSLHMLRDDEGRPTALYGYDHILYLNGPWLLERETKAVGVLFDHIRDWDKKNGNNHPIITCQVHNEPDGGVRWRMDQQNFRHRDSTLVTKAEMWKMTLDALDAIGQAVQNSSYRVATRTNIIFGDKVNPFPQAPEACAADVYALKGIDFVSVDPYKETVNEIADEVVSYASLDGNYPLVAENRGGYANTASLMLTASALGGGYCIYDLATSKYITSHSAPPFDQEGIYYCDLTEKPHTAKVSKLLKGLTAAGEDIAVTKTENFAVFNVTGDNPCQIIEQQICTTGARIDFRTENGALAFVLDMGDRLVVYSTEKAEFKLSNGTVEMPDGIVATEGGEVIEVQFTSEGALESTVHKFIGTYYDQENS